MPATPEQYEKAEQVLTALEELSHAMLMMVIHSRDGSIDNVELNEGQIIKLFNDYMAGKPLLVELFNELP